MRTATFEIQFSESGGPLTGPASSLNWLSYRNPYHNPPSLNASLLFAENPFFPLKSALLHPLPNY